MESILAKKRRRFLKTCSEIKSLMRSIKLDKTMRIVISWMAYSSSKLSKRTSASITISS